MGILIDIAHAARVRDPAHAARLFHALGASHAHVSGWAPATPDQLDALLAAAEPDRDSQITFERGTLEGAALDRLGPLALAVDGYLDINTRPASLRVWSHESWMHGYRRFPDDSITAILGTPVERGNSIVRPPSGGEVRCAVSPTAFVPFDVRTSRTDLAYRLFCAIADRDLTRGFATNFGGPVRGHLAPFLHALRASLSAELEIAVEVAAALAAQVDGELQWDGPVRIDFPGGAIATHFLAPVRPDEEQAWHRRVTDALDRAG